jgi:hypothetical protein
MTGVLKLSADKFRYYKMFVFSLTETGGKEGALIITVPAG